MSSDFVVTEADQGDRRAVMTKEDIKEEPCDYMIGCQDGDGRPMADFHGTTEAYIAEDGTYEEANSAKCTTDSGTETNISLKIVGLKTEEDESDECEASLESKSLQL